VGDQNFLIPVGGMFMNYVVTEDRNMTEKLTDTKVTGGSIDDPPDEVIVENVQTVQDSLRDQVEELEKIVQTYSNVIRRIHFKNPDHQDINIEQDNDLDAKVRDALELSDVKSMKTYDRNIDMTVHAEDPKVECAAKILESSASEEIDKVKDEYGFSEDDEASETVGNIINHASLDDPSLLHSLKELVRKDMAMLGENLIG